MIFASNFKAVRARDKRVTHQYPLDEHVVVLLGQLRATQDESAEQLDSGLPHTGGVIH